MLLTRKPLNELENPVYQCIQKEGPRFYVPKKHFIANVGDIIKQQEDNYMLIDHAVLPVSRDENQTRYGRRSYIPKVNKNFRPPIVPPEDLVPLSRRPRPTTFVRTNPDAGVRKQNIKCQDVSSFLDDKVEPYGAVSAGFRMVKGTPLDDPESFTFKMNEKMMTTPIEAGMNTPYRFDKQVPEAQTVLTNRNPVVEVQAGYDPGYTIEPFTRLDDIELNANKPMTSIDTFKSAPYTQENFTNYEQKPRNYKNNQISGHAGYSIGVKENTINPTLTEFMPREGFEYESEYTEQETTSLENLNTSSIKDSILNPLERLKLKYKNPQISYKASANTQTTQETQNIHDIHHKRTKNSFVIDYEVNKNPHFSISERLEQVKLRPTIQIKEGIFDQGVKPKMMEDIKVSLKRK